MDIPGQVVHGMPIIGGEETHSSALRERRKSGESLATTGS